jgi:predicted DNA-binding transcriptional regulator YafY
MIISKAMSYKFDSLITILRKLDNKEKITVHSLMNDLEVAERTAYRYIQTLQVAGFPIVYDRNKESYMFSENYKLSKPDLTVEETLAFALAKKLLGNFGTGMEESLKSIEQKLSVKEPALPQHIVLKAEKLSPIVEGYLGAIYQAIKNFQRIKLNYQALHSDEKTERKVDPYYLFFQDDFWHLRGYCHLREELRTFALDRITSLKTLKEYFIPKGISSEDELSGAFGNILDGEPVLVVLRFDAEIKAHVLRKKWHQSQKENELNDGRIEMRFEVNGIEGIKQWIYKWIPYVEVIEPKELKEEIRIELKKTMGKND